MSDPDNDTLAITVQKFFCEHLIKQRCNSANTVRSYRDSWKLYLRFVCRSGGASPATVCFEDITAESVLAFLDDLQSARHCSVRTRNQRLAAIRAFANYACFCQPDRLDQFRRILQIPFQRFEQRVLGYLTHEEMDAMLSAPDHRTDTGRRQATIILFLYNTGARVNEAIALNVVDIRFEKPPHVRLFGKGSKERVVPLWPDAAQRLAEQISEQGLTQTPESAVFVNRRGERITRGGIAHIVKTIQKKAAVQCPTLKNKTVSPHTLRHTTAMHLLQSGVDVNLIRCWLGHVDLSTTHQYVEADLEMKREALAKNGVLVPSKRTGRWKPTDDILAFLEGL